MHVDISTVDSTEHGTNSCRRIYESGTRSQRIARLVPRLVSSAGNTSTVGSESNQFVQATLCLFDLCHTFQSHNTTLSLTSSHPTRTTLQINDTIHAILK